MQPKDLLAQGLQKKTNNGELSRRPTICNLTEYSQRSRLSKTTACEKVAVNIDQRDCANLYQGIIGPGTISGDLCIPKEVRTDNNGSLTGCLRVVMDLTT